MIVYGRKHLFHSSRHPCDIGKGESNLNLLTSLPKNQKLPKAESNCMNNLFIEISPLTSSILLRFYFVKRKKTIFSHCPKFVFMMLIAYVKIIMTYLIFLAKGTVKLYFNMC